jgi:putative ABC transport system ATP-binding protein
VSHAILVTNLKHLHKTPTRRFLLEVPNLRIAEGEFVTCLGPSGCGKSTLLSRLGLISIPARHDFHPAKFEIVERANGADPRTCTHDVKMMMFSGRKSAVDKLRRRIMGFYLQGGELIPTLTITENVAMPLRVNGVSAREALRNAADLLAELLNESTVKTSKKLASDYSGGEYQRVALARAIIHRPQFLFVDEPTSQLDSDNKGKVLKILKERAKEFGTTVFMITHDETIAKEFSTCLLYLDRIAAGWGDSFDSRFDRETDGYGTPIRCMVFRDGTWQDSDEMFSTSSGM